MTKYRTIVADPPWPMKDSSQLTSGGGGRKFVSTATVPYERMSLPDIAALPVADLAENDAHLYLWTTNRFLEAAYATARSWRFRPGQLLVWAKTPRGIGFGDVFTPTTEFVIVARRGSLPSLRRVDSSWWQWPRGEHSAKPEAFLDLVETVSPGPYLELFARRNRIGWDTWGDECLDHGVAL